MDISVFYEDTDCGGVVYYANYLKYFERGRTDLLEEAGFSLQTMMAEGIIFTVIHAEVFYRSPAKYRDLLTIETELTEATRTVLSFRYRILEKKSRRLLVEGSTKLVPIGSEGKIKRLPPEVSVRLARLVTRPLS